jgi:hypothetical protein
MATSIYQPEHFVGAFNLLNDYARSAPKMAT